MAQLQVLQGDGTSTQMRESIWVFGYMSASVGARGSVFATQAGIGDPTLPEASLQTGYVYGDDLVAQTAYTALAAGALGANAPGDGGNDALARIGAPTGTRIAHVDGLGSTRLLTAHTLDAAGQPILTGTAQNPANETVTDRYAYSAFGDTDLASSTIVSPNAYRYTGEQLDPNLGWYYLRARYMNPGQGRFVGMDLFTGNASDPVSLHKYLYANANPVMFTDPSGNFSLGEINTSLNVQGVLSSISQVSLRQVVKQAVTGALRVARVALNEAKVCFRSPKKCKLKVPILVVGTETPETAQHILDAQLGGGSSIVNAPFWLTRKSPPNSRAWIRNHPACVGRVRGVSSCDEYPFASTEEGGFQNSVRVSLRPVPTWEQALQGGILGAFYRACGVSKVRTSANPVNDKRTFLVLATPSTIGFPLCLR